MLKAANAELVEVKLAVIEVKAGARRINLSHTPFGKEGEPLVQDFEKREIDKVMTASKEALARLGEELLVRQKEDARLFRLGKAEGPRAAPAKDDKVIIDLTKDEDNEEIADEEAAAKSETVEKAEEVAAPIEHVEASATVEMIETPTAEDENDGKGIRTIADETGGIEETAKDIEQEQLASSSKPAESSARSSLKRRASGEAESSPQTEEPISASDALHSPQKKQCVEHSENPQDIPINVALRENEQNAEVAPHIASGISGRYNIPSTSNTDSSKNKPNDGLITCKNTPDTSTSKPEVEDPKFPTKNEIKRLRKDLPFLRKVIDKEVLFIPTSVLPMSDDHLWALKFGDSFHGIEKIHDEKDVGYLFCLRVQRRGKRRHGSSRRVRRERRFDVEKPYCHFSGSRARIRTRSGSKKLQS